MQNISDRMTDAEIRRAVLALHKAKEKGGDHGNQYTGKKVAKASSQAIAKSQETVKVEHQEPGKAASETAEAVGSSVIFFFNFRWNITELN